jgi:Xaa-Pro dipeptidase
VVRSIQAAVPRARLDERRATVLAALDAADIDVAIFTTPESVLYLSGIQIGGFWGQQAIVLGRSGLHRFVVREVESHWHDNWAPQTWCTDWMTYSDSKPSAEVITDAVKSVGRGTTDRLGLELARNSISYQTVQTIAAATSPAKIVPVSHLVERMRVIKGPEEIAHMREAGRISRVGHELAAQALRDGATDAEAVAVGTSAMYGAGSEFLALGPLIAIGPESAMAHPPWRRSGVRPGELATVETSASVHRYQGPIERTYVKLTGLDDSSGTEIQNLLSLVVACVSEVVDKLRPGMTSHDADSIAREFYVEANAQEYFINRLGYSIGLAFPPVWWENDIMQLRPNDERDLEPGMAFHLVPALHIPGAGIITQSRAVVITEDGCELLNDLPLEVDPL